MMAMLFAIKIVAGDLTFAQVPRLLKDKVKAELENMGVGELATEA
ncbi:CD1375 family protein [Vaginisenegalia massiliensis]|nr:hypothetical protein [Vaginisenegalia massiliensis]